MKAEFANVAGRVSVRFHTFAARPTRGAAGMSATLIRSGLAWRGDLVRSECATVRAERNPRLTPWLSARGTLDTLRGYRPGLGRANDIVERGLCPCCGGPSGKFRLTDAGRERLRQVRGRAVVRVRQREKLRRFVVMYGAER